MSESSVHQNEAIRKVRVSPILWLLKRHGEAEVYRAYDGRVAYATDAPPLEIAENH